MDMQYPQFIAIDGTDLSDSAYPVAMAWSLADGQIKTTLVEPDESWQQWDTGLGAEHGIEPETLYQRGETTWSVVRELEADLSASTLYYNPQTDPYLPELLERLYASCEQEVQINLMPIDALIADVEIWQDELSGHCDERVYQQLKQSVHRQ